MSSIKSPEIQGLQLPQMLHEKEPESTSSVHAAAVCVHGCVYIFTQVSYEGATQLLSVLWHVDLSHQDSLMHMCFTGPSFGMDCPEDTGLEGSPGAEGGLSHHQRTGRRSHSSLEVMLWNCYPLDICLWEEWRTQWRDSVFGIHAFLKLLLALSLLYQVPL